MRHILRPGGCCRTAESGAVLMLLAALGGCASPAGNPQYSAAVAAPTIPGVGSVWISTTQYVNTGASRAPEVLQVVRMHDGVTASPHHSPPPTPEVLQVVRMHDGRPVVAGETFGYKGEIIEGAVGTVIATESCAKKVPPEYLMPPHIANQCAWHLCYPPEIGKTFFRKMIIFADLYSCEPKEGMYSFSAKRLDTTIHGNVVVGNAQVDFGMFSKVDWQSYIMPGYGEVHGDSAGRVTSYSKVDVTLAQNYTNNVAAFSADNARRRLFGLLALQVPNSEKKRECRIAAYGDSLTEGLGATREESYPAVLSRLMGFEVCNLGASGRTTSVALDAMSEVLEVHPKAVVLILGANDALRGLSSLQTKENILQMVNKLRAQGILVVLAGIDSRRPDIPKFLKDLHSLYLEIASELSDDVLFIPSAMDGILGDPELTSSDGMHPNGKGYARLAQNLFDAAFSQALDMLRAIPAMSPNNPR